MKNDEQNLCTRCNSLLIEVTKTVRQSGNPLYPITITKYQCTNTPCQEESDKKRAEAERVRLEREEKYKKTHPTIVKTP